MENLLNELNEAQKKAVSYMGGPMMVIAGAGSGKTRVLTYRVAYLIKSGIDPFSILALTFTNKAAREMKERITSLLGNTESKNVWMGTFHSIFARLLRIDGDKLGYPSNFTIYDTDDCKNLLKNIVKEMELDPKVYTPGFLLHRISSSKTSLLSATDYVNNPELLSADYMAHKPKTGDIFLAYQNRLRKAMAMDFDDLLFNTNVLLRDFPEILLKYQKKFKHILVDEYQDTNYAQYLIVKKLAARDEKICVVGDDAQSIYGFRGANIQNILNLKRDYPDLKIFKLEQNYRSTKTIVNAANSIIANNKEQIQKEIWTDNDEGNKIKLIKATSDTEEGILVANSIFESKMSYQLPDSSFAILYRTNAQSRAFEEALRKRNIPYRIYGGLSFYKRKEIKDLLAYFRITINHHDEEAIQRVINYPGRGIGQTSIEKLSVFAKENNLSLWEVIENITNLPVQIASNTKAKIDEFATMIKSFSYQLKSKPAFELAKHIANSTKILKELYEDKSPEGVSRYENIEELLNGIKEFSDTKQSEVVLIDNQEVQTNPLPTLDQYMLDIALLTDQDSSDKEITEFVSMMTIHAAKGLEFPYVYVVGLEENLFPSIQSIASRADLEEERRLFYVAITRAEKQAVLSYAETRYKWGNLSFSEPSRFIEEIDPQFIEMPRKTGFKQPQGFANLKPDSMDYFFVSKQKFENKELKKISQIPNSPSVAGSNPGSNPDLIQTGMTVDHEKFGKGKVINMEGAGPNRKATVFFQTVGQKQLLLRFAKLTIIE